MKKVTLKKLSVENYKKFEAINGSNLKFILSKVAALKLNANAQPRECYFQIRNVNVAAKGQKPQWEKKVEFAIEGDGNDALVSRYGVNVAILNVINLLITFTAK